VADSESHHDALADSVGNTPSDVSSTELSNTELANTELANAELTNTVSSTSPPVDDREPTRDCGSVTTHKTPEDRPVGTPLHNSPLASTPSATTDDHDPKAPHLEVRVPPEILKNLPTFVSEGEAYFRTVGTTSTVWGNLVVNWVRFEQSCNIGGVSHNTFFRFNLLNVV
jgi:hypothetical protein